MAVNKVVFGGETVVDLTTDTVTPETLAEGVTAHDASGRQITGTMASGGGSGGDEYAVARSILEATITEYVDEHLTSIASYRLRESTNLIYVCAPSVQSIGTYAFTACKNLEKVDLRDIETLSAYSFSNCSNLRILIIRNTNAVCSAVSTSLTGTAIWATASGSRNGYVYVPAALVDSYKESSGWSKYPDQIRAIEDYPDICG